MGRGGLALCTSLTWRRCLAGSQRGTHPAAQSSRSLALSLSQSSTFSVRLSLFEWEVGRWGGNGKGWRDSSGSYMKVQVL